MLVFLFLLKRNIMKKSISTEQVISHYNIIGMAIGVAVGIGGKDLIFSLTNDIFFPIMYKTTHMSMFNGYELNTDKFATNIFVFVIVLVLIILILNTVLRPIVKREISSGSENWDKLFDKMDAIIEGHGDQSHQIRKTNRILEDNDNTSAAYLRKGSIIARS